MNINIIGAGTWGTTLGILLDKKHYNVTIWQRNSVKSEQFSTTRIHPNLKDLKISDSISFTSDLSQLDFNHLTILAVPSHAFHDILSKVDIKNGKYLIASKGFEVNSGLLQSELLENNFDISSNNIAVISGPNHAEEIIAGMASATVIASSKESYAKELQDILSSDTFRVYTSDDIIGVQIGAAVKNVIAIASGLSVGLNMGDNTQAALVSRGMNEILSLNVSYNFKNKTLYGLSGLGDLIATCYSPHSRNRQLGILIAKGYSLEDAKAEIGMVSEGVNTCKILHQISNKHNLEMPICSEVYKILFEHSNPEDSINKLMTRSLKVEN